MILERRAEEAGHSPKEPVQQGDNANMYAISIFPFFIHSLYLGSRSFYDGDNSVKNCPSCSPRPPMN